MSRKHVLNILVVTDLHMCTAQSGSTDLRTSVTEKEEPMHDYS
jgi:hypothetical protein